MQYLINEFGLPIALLILLILLFVALVIIYLIIKLAVFDGTRRERELIESQNNILKDILKNKS